MLELCAYHTQILPTLQSGSAAEPGFPSMAPIQMQLDLGKVKKCQLVLMASKLSCLSNQIHWLNLVNLSIT